MWNELETQYGGINHQRNTLYQRIKQFPIIKKFDKENTMLLENLLNNVEDEFYLGEHGTDGSLLNDLVKPLIPDRELEFYFYENGKLDQDDTLFNFSKFIRQKRKAFTQADVHKHGAIAQKTYFTKTLEDTQKLSSPSEEEDEPLQASHATVEQPRKFIPYKRRDSSTGKNSDSSESTIKPSKPYEQNRPERLCTLCKQGHFLTACPEFRMMQIKDKLPYVMKNKLCIHCLNPGHTVKECTFHPESACNLDGCKSMHHRQLHNRTESGRTYLSCLRLCINAAIEHALITRTSYVT